jgi:hypothetical protein
MLVSPTAQVLSIIARAIMMKRFGGRHAAWSAAQCMERIPACRAWIMAIQVRRPTILRLRGMLDPNLRSARDNA